jgi:hypothetical protein
MVYGATKKYESLAKLPKCINSSLKENNRMQIEIIRKARNLGKQNLPILKM